MDKTLLSRQLPLNCPFCDEEAYPAPKIYRRRTPHKIYTLRRCIMGHEFYSVEYIPEDQSRVVKEIRGEYFEDDE